MGAPFDSGAVERPRDWLTEAYVLASVVGIADPLALPVAEFNGYIRASSRGEARRAGPMDARGYVEQWVAGR